MRLSIIFLGAVALAGCKPEPTKPVAPPTPTPTLLAVVFEKGWPEFFKDPANAIDVLNRTGARIGDYKASGGTYRAEAIPTPLDLRPSEKPNTAYITVDGSKTEVAALRYRLDVTDPSQGAAAAKSLGEMIVNSFRVLGLAGAKETAAALNAGKDATGTADGVAYAVKRETLPGGKPGTYRLTVTFDHPGANAPANS